MMFKKIVASVLLVVIMLAVTSTIVPVKSSASSNTDLILPADLQQKINPIVKIKNQDTGETFYLKPGLVNYSQAADGQTTISYEVGSPTSKLTDVQVLEEIVGFFLPSVVMADKKRGVFKNIKKTESQKACEN